MAPQQAHDPSETGFVADIVRRVPGWHAADPVITPLPGGITNRNFRVEVEGAVYVVRIPGERTELLGIDRAGEAAATTIAADLGIAPAVRAALPGVGTLVTEFVPGVVADTAALLAPGVLEMVVHAIRRLHESGPIAARFPIFRVVEWHARDAAANGVEPPADYGELRDVAQAIESVFDAGALEWTLCHNDLLPANVLLAADRLWVIDYEYAGMNHAVFDLANLSVNCGFDDDADHRLLTAYDGEATRSRLAQLALMKVMSEMREGMWAVVQQAISTLHEVDFGEYAASRLAHCRELCGDTHFGAWIDAARRR